VITIRSEESAEYVQKIAMYVDQKIEMLKSKNVSAVVDDRLRTLLIALNLADDYFKIKDQHTAQEVINKTLTDDAARYEKENAFLKNQIIILQDELDKVTAEYEEFLRNFDNAEVEHDYEYESEYDNESIVHLPKTDTRKAAN